jgi:predicted RNA binding protein YcfA (HicA-like mRNA interferase family)
MSALARAGFAQISQRGSHVKLRKITSERTLTVIVKHLAKDVPKGTLS